MSVGAENPGRRLRQRLNGGRALLLPGAADALAARVVERIGFEAIYVTGAGLANAHLGLPDLGLVTLTELAAQVAAIRDVVALPLVVDADTGFGNALNVHRAVKVLERSGANALQIEDQVSPKRCGHFEGKQVIPADEMVQKIHAAVDARNDENLLIIARTDARADLGFSVAIERAAQYLEAGADVTFIEAPQSVEEIAAIPGCLRAPQMINMVEGGRTPLLSLDELSRMGYAIVLYANAGLRGAIRGMQRVLEHLYQEGSTTGVLDEMVSWDERQGLVGKPFFDELEQKYRV